MRRTVRARVCLCVNARAGMCVNMHAEYVCTQSMTGMRGAVQLKLFLDQNIYL